MIEFLLIGAGLSNCLLALKLLEQKRKFILVERKNDLSASQTWSFHETDVTREQLNWLKPVIAGSWESYEIKFEYERTINIPYHSITAEKFFTYVKSKLSSEQVILNSTVTEVKDNYAIIDGKKVLAKCVIDGRGITEVTPTGYQKFVGIDLHFEKPHGQKHPVIMDAAILQTDGYRFMYSLPWDEKTILVEDTHYSNTPHINADFYRHEIKCYAEAKWGSQFKLGREEVASLPIPLTENIFSSWHEILKKDCGVPMGLKGGFFHPTTGYSFPWALTNAEKTAAINHPNTRLIKKVFLQNLNQFKNQSRFFLFLNRMLFGAALPQERVKVFSRFYRFNPEFISRFYGARLTNWDKANLLMGRPPVKISRALRSVLTNSWMESLNHVHP